MLSAVVLTRNEEKNIRECLETLSFCDEILVIDDYSEDKTVEIAKKLGARVIQHALNNDFATQRNFGLEKTKREWVLFVDADERVPSALAEEIKNEKLEIKNDYDGFFIKRTDVLWNREFKYGETGSIELLRLARRGSGVWKRKVHEYWDIEGSVGNFHNPLLHYPHQTLTEFFSDINFYAKLHAQQKVHDGEESDLITILIFPILKFVYNWIIKRGFLDGTPGFISAVMMSFHSFLAWSEVWLLQRVPRVPRVSRVSKGT